MRKIALAATSLVLLLCGCPQGKPATTLTSTESWCPDGFEVGPQDTCFAVPETTSKTTPILVYLHGQYTGHGSPEEWRVVRSAVAKGFAVVVPRGKRGLCAWKAELKDHFCWPQEVDDPHAFKATVAEWDRVLWQVEQIMEGGTHKRYVLGFSNGGFFGTYLATHGFFNASAYAFVNAGPLGAVNKAMPKAMPVLLVSAQDDAAQAPTMKTLHEELGKAAWTHAYCTRPGPHPIAQTDVDAALAFFKREQEGTLKEPYTCEGGTANGDPTAPPPSSDKPEKADKPEKPAKPAKK
ncbi:MAG: hypothetical protein JST00_15295 [Deltaproteobacteria bacterium]|nr:hypothetical protein [Deltaproteobacteria bacterium]